MDEVVSHRQRINRARPVFARLASVNLTRGKGGIGQTFSDSDYVRSIRYGVRPDGKPVIFMPSEWASGPTEEF
jgi:hypothetical protein